MRAWRSTPSPRGQTGSKVISSTTSTDGQPPMDAVSWTSATTTTTATATTTTTATATATPRTATATAVSRSSRPRGRTCTSSSAPPPSRSSRSRTFAARAELAGWRWASSRRMWPFRRRVAVLFERPQRGPAHFLTRAASLPITSPWRCHHIVMAPPSITSPSSPGASSYQRQRVLTATRRGLLDVKTNARDGYFSVSCEAIHLARLHDGTSSPGGACATSRRTHASSGSAPCAGDDGHDDDYDADNGGDNDDDNGGDGDDARFSALRRAADHALAELAASAAAGHEPSPSSSASGAAAAARRPRT